jgi:hypothetical protein
MPLWRRAQSAAQASFHTLRDLVIAELVIYSFFTHAGIIQID